MSFTAMRGSDTRTQLAKCRASAAESARREVWRRGCPTEAHARSASATGRMSIVGPYRTVAWSRSPLSRSWASWSWRSGRWSGDAASPRARMAPTLGQSQQPAMSTSTRSLLAGGAPAVAAAVGFLVIAAFQIALAFGAPLGVVAWGGTHPGPPPAGRTGRRTRCSGRSVASATSWRSSSCGSAAEPRHRSARAALASALGVRALPRCPAPLSKAAATNR